MKSFSAFICVCNFCPSCDEVYSSVLGLAWGGAARYLLCCALCFRKKARARGGVWCARRLSLALAFSGFSSMFAFVLLAKCPNNTQRRLFPLSLEKQPTQTNIPISSAITFYWVRVRPFLLSSGSRAASALCLLVNPGVNPLKPVTTRAD